MNLLEEDNTPQTDPTKDYLQELVGEGKKFKTPAELARGKFEADSYISTLTKKMDELRSDYVKLDADYKARASLEELMDKYSKLSNQQQSINTIPEVKDRVPEIDPKQIESLIDTRIKTNKILEREQANFDIAKEKLKEAFGSNYQVSLNERIENLGLTVEDVNAMAKKSPTALVKMLELEKTSQNDDFQTPPRSSRRNDSFTPKGGPKRTWSYYQELKKANPKLYYDPKINIQMEKDHQALGEAFEDGDFNS